MSYPPYAEVMGPVLAAIANGTLIQPRPVRAPLPAVVLPTTSSLSLADRIEADLANNVDKAQRAIQAHERKAMRLQRNQQSGSFA